MSHHRFWHHQFDDFKNAPFDVDWLRVLEAENALLDHVLIVQILSVALNKLRRTEDHTQEFSLLL